MLCGDRVLIIAEIAVATSFGEQLAVLRSNY
jgi:hypothetical protein